jgi:ABC-type multidrug transport system fused ATPase/permease subunit
MHLIKKLIFFLSSRERKQVVLLFSMILVMAFLDLLGVASIMPFMAIVLDPDVIETNKVLNLVFKFSNNFGVDNKSQFVFLVGILVFFLLVFSLTFKALTSYVQVRFSKMREYTICKRLLEGYLHQPYSWFLNRNSSNLTKTIITEVDMVVNVGLYSLILFLSQLTIIIFISTFLLFIKPFVTACIIVVLGSTYLIIYKFSKNFVKKISKERMITNEQRFNSLNEAFGSFKQLKVGGLEKIFFQRFKIPAISFAKSNANILIISQLPRFVIEAIVFGSLILVVLYIIAKKGELLDAIPIISLYAFAGYRLMPLLQKTYQNYLEFRFSLPAINSLYKDLKNLQTKKNFTSNRKIKFKKYITLNNVFYNYPDSPKKVLKNISLKIPAYSSVGFVGSTGSGKTTIADIILGLLETQKGTLAVDDKIINANNIRAWQIKIGYVPQDIYLADDTIEANIAFGIEDEKINYKAVEQAAKIANLHDFVVNELPAKYQTLVGERGIRLSGGQRQRIGIARALYLKPEVLILDEATSALDNQTEHLVMQAINNLSDKITIIIIAHRLSTVEKCDQIYLLDNGEIKANGSFEQLKQVSKKFKTLTMIN